MTETRSLLGRLETAADSSGWIAFCHSAGNGTEPAEIVEWSRLHEDARRCAAALQARGVSPGDHLAILGPTTRDLVTAIQATWLCGATTVMLPLPMRLASIDEFVRQTRTRIAAADCALVIADPQLAEFLAAEPGDPPIVFTNDLTTERLPADRFARPPDDADALAILQYTSGSTADPKGVMLPHRCVTANLDGIVSAAQIQLDDVAVSWLPLYHDMGLIGLLTVPMTTGTSLALMAPQDFLAAPVRWMEAIDAFGGTVTAGPSFSYALAARALARHEGLDLSRWRLALNGAEPVDPDAVEAFVAASASHQLPASSVFPAFGMAEATLAVTFPEPGTGLRTDSVDPRVLETEHYAAPKTTGATRRLAKLGRPVSGLAIRIVDPETGSRRHEREVGELEIRGESVTPGYYRRPEATAAALRDGWLRTGDLGYLVDGELVVCGRLKDVIILGGRNVYPQDVERAVEAVEGIRTGNVIAFGVDGRKGRESIVVVAETKSGDDITLRDTVRARVHDSVGTAPEEVVLVRPGTLPKTSSGKLQRSLCKSRWAEADLALA